MVEGVAGLVRNARSVGFFEGFKVGRQRVEVEDNPRRYATWKSVVDLVEKILASWKCRHISYVGKLVLLNFVLTIILVYMLSLYKAPKKVINKIVTLQRTFLWGMKSGGRGVKDLSLFNESLSRKWKWIRRQEA
ncbi:hypothetical protein Lal_00026865 [Lupinus albus]|nr:hypothetical protein Lal_00026865 [Lupinus albus]